METKLLIRLLKKKEKVKEQLKEVEALIEKEVESIQNFKIYRLKNKTEVLKISSGYEDWSFFNHCGKDMLLKPCTYYDLQDVTGVYRGDNPALYMKTEKDTLIPVSVLKL